MDQDENVTVVVGSDGDCNCSVYPMKHLRHAENNGQVKSKGYKMGTEGIRAWMKQLTFVNN